MPNYVPSQIVPGARIMFVGEAPGEKENTFRKPFYHTAPAGHTFTHILNECNLNRLEVDIANVARRQPPGNKINFYFEDQRNTIPKPELLGYIQELKEEIEQNRPNIVVAMGATAMWALLGEKGLQDNRGYIQESTLVKGVKVMPTWHPQAVNYDYSKMFPTVMDVRKAIRHSKTPHLVPDRRRLNAFPSFAEVMDYYDYLIHDHKEPIALDIESINGHITIIGIADSPLHAVSFSLIEPNGKPRLITESEYKYWLRFAEVVKRRETIMHNGLYDMAMLWYRNHIMCSKYTEDTMIQGHVVFPEAPRSLAFMTSICTDSPKWKYKSSELPTLYNAEDAANTYGVWETMNQEMDRLKMRKTYQFEMMQVWPATKMQLQGVPVSPRAKNILVQATKVRIDALEKKLQAELGWAPNTNSPKDMRKVLYKDLQMPVQYLRRKSRFEERKVTTNAEALKKLDAKFGNPIVSLIMELKKAYKLLTFVDIELSPEQNVHTSYNITGATMARQKGGQTATFTVDDEESYKSFGRWSSSKSIILPYGSGNLQNIPYTARKMYRAPQGYVYLQADYIQAEAVVVAYCINDVITKQMFQDSFGMSPDKRKASGYDIHRNTYAMMFNIDPADVTKEQRKIGKTLRHATNYSAGPRVVATWLGIEIAKAKLLLEKFHNATPQLSLWHSSIREELANTRTLVNLLGRKHRFLGRWDDNLFRSAYSYIPQSTVGDLLNLALVRLYNKFGDAADIRLQLHDAIYCIVPEKEIDTVIGMLQESMIIPLVAPDGTPFQIDVDFAVGHSWGEMDEI